MLEDAVHADTADEGLVGMIENVLENGHRICPRGAETVEVTNLKLTLANPRARVVANPMRDVQEHYMAAKVVWDLAERSDVASIGFWNSYASKFSDDGTTVQGENYGQRWSPYMRFALELLHQDRDSRRAWIPVWHGRDLASKNGLAGARSRGPSFDSKNVPCCIGFGLRIIDDRLVMQTVMRSQSVVGVFPYDVFLFTYFQELLANELEVELGRYEHVMLSAHIYERELDFANKIVEEWDRGDTESGWHAPSMGYTTLNFSNAAEWLVPAEERLRLDSGDLALDVLNEEIVDMMIPYAREQHHAGDA